MTDKCPKCGIGRWGHVPGPDRERQWINDEADILRRQLAAAVADKEQAQSEASAAVATMEEFQKMAVDRGGLLDRIANALMIEMHDNPDPLEAIADLQADKERAEAACAAMQAAGQDLYDWMLDHPRSVLDVADSVFQPFRKSLKPNPGQPLLDRLAALEADNAR